MAESGDDRDPLTGLVRTGTFQAHLDARCRVFAEQGESATPFIIGLVDVEGIRHINRDLGHVAGDELLRQLAERLTSIWKADLVARVGPDEFAILAVGIAPEDGGQWVRSLRLNVLSKPFDLAGSVEKVNFHVTRRSGPPSPGHDLLWDLLRDALVDRTREFYQSIDAYERQLRPVLVENERLRNLAMRDHLTGLLNRRGMYEHLEQIALPRSLAFVDLDDLSELNKLDERWEDGDAAIAGLADRLRDAFGDENVARWGGDEFLLVSPTGSAEETADLLRRILEECQTELVISGRPITFSAGVTDCSGGLEAARPRAEEAVSTAKQKKATIVCAG